MFLRGLFGLFGPDEVPGRAAREIYEILAGACGVTFFVWVQHHAPVRLLQASPNAGLRQRWIPRLVSGQVLGGVAFAHLRRPGPAARSWPAGWRAATPSPARHRG